jgi:hypothetical protein
VVQRRDPAAPAVTEPVPQAAAQGVGSARVEPLVMQIEPYMERLWVDLVTQKLARWREFFSAPDVLAAARWGRRWAAVVDVGPADRFALTQSHVPDVEADVDVLARGRGVREDRGRRQGYTPIIPPTHGQKHIILLCYHNNII